jgi:outer membrane murein-binding lipoprotein Lpp
MNLRTPKLFAVSLVLAGTFLTGCQRETAGPDLKAEVERLTAELNAATGKISGMEKQLQEAKDELALAAAGAEAAKREASERDSGTKLKDAQIGALETRLSDVMKSDGLAYMAASALMQNGAPGNALEKYQKFVTDFPESPLVADAKRAIVELSPVVAKDAQWRQNLIDPRRGDRELIKRFGDGIVTMEELSPLLRRRSAAEVVKLLGTPSRTYRNGTEIGYEDKVIDSKTGNKATLVIKFVSDRVDSLRLGYQGREVKP